MQIRFLGAAREVTGSCFLVDTGRLRFVVDCGMHQGGREAGPKNRAFPAFDPAGLDFALVTHAHLDHCGLLPVLSARAPAPAGLRDARDGRPAAGDAPRQRPHPGAREGSRAARRGARAAAPLRRRGGRARHAQGERRPLRGGIPAPSRRPRALPRRRAHPGLGDRRGARARRGTRAPRRLLRRPRPAGASRGPRPRDRRPRRRPRSWNPPTATACTSRWTRPCGELVGAVRDTLGKPPRQPDRAGLRPRARAGAARAAVRAVRARRARGAQRVRRLPARPPGDRGDARPPRVARSRRWAGSPRPCGAGACRTAFASPARPRSRWRSTPSAPAPS